ncbi:MAG TPA: helix-turn-helix domain-containing protein [Gemmataceae bacterium]|nr:helix-turn-helix domain-containing protein [Gemmataceae bacterium]
MPTRGVLGQFLLLPENRSALTACRELLFALTDGSEDFPSPLYVHGPAGSGKSHLMRMLANELTAVGRSVHRLAAHDLADAELDRETDLLIIEDLQHLPTRATPTLIALLDERSAAGLATVVTALVGPANLKHRGTTMPTRLTSRLAAGLVVAVEPMQRDSRRRFLDALAQQARLTVANDVLDWLAEQLTGGGRQIEGAVRQLKSLQGMQARPLRLAEVRGHFRTQIEAAALTMKRIAEHVCGYYQVAPKHLLSARRSREVLLPRQISMYLARQLTPLSLVQIGKYFGGRDHKTVQHACRKVAAAIKTDRTLSGTIRQMRAELS